MPPNYQNSYPDPRQRIQRLGILLCSLVILFFIGRLALHFIATGTVTVTTGNQASIVTVSTVPSPSGAAKTTQQGKGPLTVRVPSGTYVVSVRYATSTTNQTVKLGWLSHKNISVSPPKAAAVEPVLYDPIQDMIADTNRIAYLNSDTNGIEYVGSGNEESSVTASANFTSVAWADTQYGVGQDQSGNLYIINGNNAHRVSSSIFKGNAELIPSTVYAIAPNRTIYIGLGSNVYRGTEQSGFKKIYSKLVASDQLVASNDQVLIVTPRNSNGGSAAVVLSTNGQKVDKNFSTIIGGWTPWSRNGKYIVMSIGQEPALFDASLKQVGTIPQPVVTNEGDQSHTSSVADGAWLGDNTFFYHYAGQLWNYNIAQKISNIVATMPNSETILGVTATQDGSYAYVITSSDGFTPIAVRRIGLHGQNVASVITQLQSFLPISTPSYSVGMRNFSGQPVIVIVVPIDGDTDSAVQSAKSDIQSVIGNASVTYETEEGD